MNRLQDWSVEDLQRECQRMDDLEREFEGRVWDGTCGDDDLLKHYFYAARDAVSKLRARLVNEIKYKDDAVIETGRKLIAEKERQMAEQAASLLDEDVKIRG